MSDDAQLMQTSGCRDGGFDCFNEDLVWILNKLVVRTGGMAGTLSGQMIGLGPPTPLAAVGDDTPLTQELVFRSASVPACTVRGAHDAPNVIHSLLSINQPEGEKRRYRVLQLAFSPAEGVKVIASVAKESRLGFKFLEDATARRLYPVLSRYIRLWWVHRAERRSALALKTAIDQSDLAIMLLNRAGRLLFANARANALLMAGDGLSVEDRSVVPVVAEDRAQFASAVSAGLANNEGVSPVGSATLQIGRTNAKRKLIVTVLPLRTPALDTEDPAVIVYGMDPDQDVEELLAPVCAIYKLTTAETRLVGKLISGNTLTEAAERINIRPQTARAYLKSIFVKTRTHRQAELVRVMLSSTLPTSAAR
jgi:DNA-binding CsgD family transcriptional regulator/PAS domain-containing protein